jgi:muramoyltetrapeptide carboxypeptidase
LVAPAGPLSVDRIERSELRCRDLGLEPVVFPSAAARDRYLAGSDAERARDLQAAFDDPSIDGVWALRGGYGSLRILDRLDLRRQLNDPIPFIGFSDNTTIHSRHAALGVISFHGPHPGAEFPPETRDSFENVLFKSEKAGRLVSRAGDPAPRTLYEGRVEAPLVGGNLAMLASLCGSPDAASAEGCILFLEDIGEPAYRIDRMLTQLDRAGLFGGVAGLAFGRFSPQQTGDGDPVEEVLAELVQRLKVPAVLELPFGHVEHNCTLPVGGMAELDGDGATLTLTEPAVTL